MPTFVDSLSSDDAWDLTQYIQSLSDGYAKVMVGGGADKPAGGGK
jgi:hypothetical protein